MLTINLKDGSKKVITQFSSQFLVTKTSKTLRELAKCLGGEKYVNHKWQDK